MYENKITHCTEHVSANARPHQLHLLGRPGECVYAHNTGVWPYLCLLTLSSLLVALDMYICIHGIL